LFDDFIIHSLITDYRIEQRALKKNAGEVDHTREAGALISINTTQNDDHKRQTLWHELMHVASVEMDIELSEQQVNSLATWWKHCVDRNPDLGAFLLGYAPRRK